MNKVITPNPVEPVKFYTFIESSDQRTPRFKTLEAAEDKMKQQALENPHKTFILLGAVEYCNVKQKIELTQVMNGDGYFDGTNKEEA